jgi:hypothetical protein
MELWAITPFHKPVERAQVSDGRPNVLWAH